MPDTFMDDLLEQGRGEGRTQGEKDGILRVLDARGIKVSRAKRERIISCYDIEQLREWITRAATVKKASDIFR